MSMVSKKTKIVQPDSEFALLKCDDYKTQNYPKDRIGELPDEILVLILSLLTTDEAIRTSVLARRWRYLWTFISHLDFDDDTVVSLLFCRPPSPTPTDSDLEPTYPPFLVQRRRFVDWVNRVLNLHKGMHLDEFRLRFGVYGDHFKSDIDSWINFAFQKRVKRLHLLFECSWASPNRTYTLTLPMLCNYRLYSLMELRLCAVEVTGEVLEYFLSACPLLEFLYVSMSRIGNLKISGPSLRLKHLDISYCMLDSLDIYAENLVSFTYVGPKKNISFKYTPKLVMANIAGPYVCYFIKSLFQLPSYISQLETLVLDIGDEKLTWFPKFPKLRNLKRLELVLNHRVFCLLLCTSLLRASPSLNRFTIEFYDFEIPTKKKMEVKKTFKVKKSKFQHKCLKVVKLIGFVGCGVDLEIASYISSHTMSLEMIIINPRLRYNTPEDTCIEARSRARQHLETRLPPGTQLVLL